jgi:hypothetical protein
MTFNCKVKQTLGCLTLFFTTVKIILIYQCHTGPAEAGFKSKRTTWSRFRQPSEASKTILYLSKNEGAIFLTRII